MKKLLKLFYFLLILILACISLGIGNILYGNWLEYKKINNLTIKHGDELFKAVEKYENTFTLNGYVDRNELDKYATGPELRLSQKTWDAVNNGESVFVAIEINHPQVVSYTTNVAELVVEVHKKEIMYGSNGPETVSTYNRVVMAGYILQLENSVWKVSWIDACPMNDERCIRYLKHIEERWYHMD